MDSIGRSNMLITSGSRRVNWLCQRIGHYWEWSDILYKNCNCCKNKQISHTLNLAAKILEKKVFWKNQKKSKVKSWEVFFIHCSSNVNSLLHCILVTIFGKKVQLICGFLLYMLNKCPLTPMSDLDRISPYSINTISSRRVMRIKKNIN